MRCLILRYSFPVSLFYLIIIACQSEHPNTIKTFSSDDISRECAKANVFFDNSFDRRLSRDPEQQSYFGIKMNYGKWTDHSDAHAKSTLILINWMNKHESVTNTLNIPPRKNSTIFAGVFTIINSTKWMAFNLPFLHSSLMCTGSIRCRTPGLTSVDWTVSLNCSGNTSKD